MKDCGQQFQQSLPTATLSKPSRAVAAAALGSVSCSPVNSSRAARFFSELSNAASLAGNRQLGETLQAEGPIWLEWVRQFVHRIGKCMR